MSDDILLNGSGAAFSANYKNEKIELDRLSRLNAKATESMDEKEKAAQDFEALLLKQMLQSMWATVPQDGLLSGSQEEQYYRDFLSDAISKNIAETQSIGIKEVILKDMNKYEGSEEK